MSGATKNIRVHPMQARPDENARGHQNNYVGNVRKSNEPVGNKRKNEKAAKNCEEER
jgi:hypothetical protein